MNAPDTIKMYATAQLVGAYELMGPSLKDPSIIPTRVNVVQITLHSLPNSDDTTKPIDFKIVGPNPIHRSGVITDVPGMIGGGETGNLIFSSFNAIYVLNANNEEELKYFTPLVPLKTLQNTTIQILVQDTLYICQVQGNIAETGYLTFTKVQ